MIKISSSQMQIFTDQVIENFVTKSVACVARHWPGQVTAAGPGPTRARVKQLCHAALAHGFATERQTLRYINASFALGDGFADEHDWAAEILSRRNHSPEVRSILLTEAVQDWLDGFAPP